MQHSYEIIGIIWLVFWIYWFLSAIGKKKVIKSSKPGHRIIFTVLIIALVITLNTIHLHIQRFTNNLSILILGEVIFVLGLAFAVWARIHLGKNWNSQPSVQENHELVTSGPYSIVRHPIYTGLIIAFIGCIIAGNIIWVIFFTIALVAFVWRVKTEEKLMIQTFPQQYPEYMKRTKALIPFIW